jgi:hypothetical protein
VDRLWAEKGFARTNALAYFGPLSLTKKKIVFVTLISEHESELDYAAGVDHTSG